MMKTLFHGLFRSASAARSWLVAASLLAALALSAVELPEKDWERIDLDDDHTSIEAPDKTRRSSAIPDDTAGDLTVPSTLKGMKVVSIGQSAFYNCSELTSVVIPEGVTNVGDNAFEKCASLTNVVFPASLKSIGKFAFVECPNLKAVDLSVARLDVGTRAFRDCDGLETVRLRGDSVSLGEKAFFGCGGLRSFDVDAKQVALGASVCAGGTDSWETVEREYGGCASLSNVAIRSSGTLDLGETAFQGCPALTNVEIRAAGTLTVGKEAFGSCPALVSAILEDEKTSQLAAGVFDGCSALRTVTLPVGLTGVPTNLFHACSALEAVALSSNVQEIAYRAFDSCSALRDVSLAEGLRRIDSQAFFGCAALQRLVVPQSLSGIGSRAFEECSGLCDVVFCGGDTNLYEAIAVVVEERAFYKASSLTNVVLSTNVVALGSRAFAECESLARVTLSEGLDRIFESAFESCERLTEVSFPASLQSIGKTAFKNCLELSDFLIPTNNDVTVGANAFANTRFWNDWPNDSLVVNNGYILGFKGNPTDVVLPDTCREIPSGMFEGMTALTNVYIPKTVTTVGSRAFAGSGVRNVDFSDTVLLSLGASAFEGCASLESCVLSAWLTDIPDDAFKGCSSLVEINIPATVRSIGSSGFQNCSRLKTVEGCAGLTTIGDYAFAGCVALDPFKLPDGVTYGDHVFQSVEWTENVLFPSIGTMADEYPNSYSNVRSVVFSASLTSLVSRACAGCVLLEAVSIPEKVSSIGESAFEGCQLLESVAFPAGLSSVASNAFAGCRKVVLLTTSGQVSVRKVFPDSYANITSITFAAGTDTLCDEVLSGCAAITTVTIPNDVTEIGEYAFADCTSLGPGILIPEDVDSIGDYAFMNCRGLRVVWYMGACPTADASIYSGTQLSLMSGVRREYASSWAKTSDSSSSNTTSEATLPDRWPAATSAVGGRGIAWWKGPDKTDTKDSKITFYYYDTTGGRERRAPDDWLDEPPNEREGYDFVGWFSLPYGGVEVTEDNYEILGVTEVYAHWIQNRTGHDDPQEWDDVVYDVNKAHTYDGYLLDGNAVVGTIQVKMAKGKLDRSGETASVTMTAKVLLLGEGKSVTHKGLAEDVSKEGGSGELASIKKGDERTLTVDFCGNELHGDFDGYDVVASRNLFAESTDWDKRAARAALDNWADSYTVILQPEGGEGYAVLQAKIAAKGKVKVSGTMPDGTKVSVSSQLQVGQEYCEVPVVAPLYTRKEGGFGFLIRFVPEDGPEILNLSEWTVIPRQGDAYAVSLVPAGESGIARTEGLASSAIFSLDGVFVMEDDVATDLLPDSVPIAVKGSRWTLPSADTVKFDRETETWEIVKDKGNPSGLKLSYSASTGQFKGSFRVYAVTQAGKGKKYTAQVTGGILDGVGYGTATIKNVGSVSVTIVRETRREETASYDR